MDLGIVLVSVSGLVHAVWNLFAKRSINKVVFLWLFQGVAVIAYLPWALLALRHHVVPPAGWLLLLGTTAVHGLYVMLLARTYRLGDLSQVYPLMRGMSPLLVPLIGVTLLGDSLTPWGWLGVSTILAGILLLGRWKRRDTTSLDRAATFTALAVGLTVVGYTSLDKVTLHDIPAVTLNNASNLGNWLALSWGAVRSRAIRTEWHLHRKAILASGLLSPASYLLFLPALTTLPLARVAPLREISTVFGMILGVVVLKERPGWIRLVGAGLIALGVAAVAVG